LVLKKKIEG